MTIETIEFAAFRLKAGICETELHEAADSIQRDFLAKQPGYLRRELVKTVGGYADLLLWSSPETASAAMSKAAASPVCARYFALMDMNDDGAGVQHWAVVGRY